MNRPIYLDHHATTPCDPRVVEKMLPFFCEKFGNAASDHFYGHEVRKDCAEARKQVAMLVGAKATEITFTSGATEGNNLVIKGVAQCHPHKRMISCVTEHKSVLDTLKCLQAQGTPNTLLAVNAKGHIDLEELERELCRKDAPEVALVSLMAINNEIGTIHPLRAIGEMCRKHGVLFHVDAAQAAGKISIDVAADQIDFLSLSGHKMYAPKGIGALYFSPQVCAEKIRPQLHGGGQEKGFRPGTLPVSLVVAMGEASRIAREEFKQETQHLKTLRDRLWASLQKIDGIGLNGDPGERHPGNLSVTIRDLDSEGFHRELRSCVVSSTSACSAGSGHPSHVLEAIGRSPTEARASLRFGMGRFNTTEDILKVVAELEELIPKFRQTSIGQNHRQQRTTA